MKILLKCSVYSLYVVFIISNVFVFFVVEIYVATMTLGFIMFDNEIKLKEKTTSKRNCNCHEN